MPPIRSPLLSLPPKMFAPCVHNFKLPEQSGATPRLHAAGTKSDDVVVTAST